MKKQNKTVSYYDIKDKDKYLADDKNLKKIRSKNLRDFCKFVRDMKEMPLILSLFKKVNYEETQTKDFAQYILNKIKRENSAYHKEVEKIAKQRGYTHVSWITKRTIYDYMNAYKFILACERKEDRMVLNLIQKKK